jgi:ATP-dependent Lhr-like helicase
VDEEKLHVEVEAAPPSLTAIPGWEGDMIPVQMDVASEVGRMRRIVALADGQDTALPVFEKQKVVTTLNLQEKQSSIPSDKLVLIEGFENSVIVHTCAGNLVNETLADTMAALFGSRLGSNIATQVDQYRFALIFPRPVSAHMVAEEFQKLTPSELENMIHDTVEASDLFAWRHWHVLRRIGAVSREAEYKSRQARLLVDIFKNSIANTETRRELFAEKLDVEGAKKLLAMIGNGEVKLEVIQDAGQCTPLAVPLLDRIVPHGLLRPAVEEASIMEVVKSRLLSTRLRLLCMNCADWDSIRDVDTLQDHVRCPKCHSTLIAATYWGNDGLAKIMQKKKRGMKLIPEEEKEWMTGWRSAGLLQTYGKKAALVLAARGVGPTIASRILRNRAREDDLYLSILKAEREFERTRMFWD